MFELLVDSIVVRIIVFIRFVVNVRFVCLKMSVKGLMLMFVIFVESRFGLVYGISMLMMKMVSM